ncbi:MULTISPECIES: apolipoprotein N-acyltransferase [unclassified Lentimonas]|uniref:apolipoprotein N-acyltransferase n=1 Tax=unclassified Lentimonas TaxID=2630993 RepID=UPI001325933F|nr:MULTISPECIES: apolipoprotein N-acyltransferase [unclassified Lentimonas]CAA6676486.1 Apolipoprotein N-acyltransferase (EC / Copper homeostasis protein CutE [Lentimonas sp. CC4]CAA6685326.1 Apolipoprotein N-acyltransferase (EC / Copper homeostasis protein CutE [Lentimonas sp. CC6]CAA7074950.1 Apolipoprotein N-acyltransferase (EC / Copper homeostasis protein CutE [Lentimonas sp. CC4]CAA7169577.1 Apolipoprotein N-acyltransferase (EC / Copper homeostasis protein CutE [Lentimonas sp. CC21]CAA718
MIKFPEQTDESPVEELDEIPVVQRSPLWGLLAGLLSVVLWVLSIPPFEFAEAAYIAFIPLILWLYTHPSRRLCVVVAMGTGWVAWFAILVWLRHVTFFGTVGLSAILAAIFTLWVLLVHWLLPLIADRSFLVRALAFAGMAGAWVVLEWSRTWLLWGFPWAPLSLSQWERPVVLQIAAWTGAYGLSFLLVYFNFCIAQTLRNRVVVKKRKLWSGWFSLDLYVAMALLGLCIFVFLKSLPQRGSDVTLFTAAVVQPYITPELKWDEDREVENLEILERQTQFVASLESDLVLWPEAATPWPVMGNAHLQRRVEALVNDIDKPILMGNLAVDRETELWYNGAFLVEPETGLSDVFYVKRELVPFGEFVPSYLSFIQKVVPVGGSFVPGTEPGLIEMTFGENTVKIGSLVCYEDVFPSLARESAQAGAQVFFVATNNAWYGEEGGAPQHAAHSVLRAVENRRPVMRCGNGGWSGWIDCFGTIRDVLVDENNSVYFRGGGAYTVVHYEQWMRQQSFYTRHGDWFVALSGGFVLAAMALGLLLKKNGS